MLLRRGRSRPGISVKAESLGRQKLICKPLCAPEGGSTQSEVQHQDARLCNAWSQVRVVEGVQQGEGLLPQGYFLMKNGLLYYLVHRRGYWKVLLAQADWQKMAFSTPVGQYQYHALLFGLHGPPAFQGLMDIVLRPMQRFAAVYLDDVVIHSATWEEHLDL
ncbi:hypothetical protein SKAU_G00245270 [Synaphobranchus kaupii]|uniref:Reverse transcriptase domain-containing protein n=1 Tax=Synaphobranchus kaupii TaxID=118154 RepID=A0A9Q1F266_SYNKA|nr:hypothetical protein SKAU_G00245270 [Synaphobranchus kaupii]